MRRASRLLISAALLLGAAVATPSHAGTIYATAFDDIDFFFQVNPEANGDGAYTSNFGHLKIGKNGQANDLPLTAMAGLNGQLVGSKVHQGGEFDYYFRVDPQANGIGGYSSYAGDIVTQNEFGSQFDLPVDNMAPLAGELFGSSWNDGFNYFYKLIEQSDGTGAYGDYFGGLTLGEGGEQFGFALDSMASYDGQLYGTAFDGVNDLFFRINRDADGTGAWIDGLGAIDSGSTIHPGRLSAMVGTDDGLFGVSWDETTGSNYFFGITPGLQGYGGDLHGIGNLHISQGGPAGALPYKINTLAYLPTPDGPIAGAVPEPATWAMMILGFGAVGVMTRSARRKGVLVLA